MPLSKSKITEIEEVLKNKLRQKFLNYKPEPAHMPFHTRLLGKDRMALFSFIHSLNTNFGTSIFEPVTISLAKGNFIDAKLQQTAGTAISSEAYRVIQNIMTSLETSASEPDMQKEISAIRKVCLKGKMLPAKLTKVDIHLISKDGIVYLIDLKTAKPNAGGFREFKRTLLEWTAAVLATNANNKIHSLIAIPYNPYEPGPYRRWTMRGMLDLKYQIKVAEEFWDFVGGEGSYNELLNIFERVGIELRPEIDEYFKKYIK